MTRFLRTWLPEWDLQDKASEHNLGTETAVDDISNMFHQSDLHDCLEEYEVVQQRE